MDRDISNKNELMIAAPFFNEDKNEVKRVVFQIIEQNDTKAKKIYESLKEVLEISSVFNIMKIKSYYLKS